MTKECAASLPIGRVVDLAVQQYSKKEGEHLQALYNRVKGQKINCYLLSNVFENEVGMLYSGFDLFCPIKKLHCSIIYSSFFNTESDVV